MTLARSGLRRWRRAVGGAQGGYTFVELLVVAAVVLVMATAVLPLS